jgi:hypothetical protein
MRVEQEMKMKTKIIPSLTKRSSGIFPTGAVFARFCLQCVLCGEKFERPRPGRCVVASVFFFPLYALLRQAFFPSRPASLPLLDADSLRDARPASPRLTHPLPAAASLLSRSRRSSPRVCRPREEGSVALRCIFSRTFRFSFIGFFETQFPSEQNTSSQENLRPGRATTTRAPPPVKHSQTLQGSSLRLHTSPRAARHGVRFRPRPGAAVGNAMCPMRVWLLFFSGIIAAYLAWTSSLFGSASSSGDATGKGSGANDATTTKPGWRDWARFVFDGLSGRYLLNAVLRTEKGDTKKTPPRRSPRGAKEA